MYGIFVSICQQIKEDSQNVEQMDAKQREFFVRLYHRFKDLLPFMTLYRPTDTSDDIAKVDLNEVMDLPHMEEVKQELKSKVLKRITFLPSVKAPSIRSESRAS